jgi:hypothetical protein
MYIDNLNLTVIAILKIISQIINESERYKEPTLQVKTTLNIKTEKCFININFCSYVRLLNRLLDTR